MRILGVDPGSDMTGYGVIDARADGRDPALVSFGQIAGQARRRALPERLARVYEGLVDILDAYRPDEVVVEGVFHARNARAALTIGHVRGVVLLAAAQRGRTPHEYAPPEVKLAVCGNGAAGKRQVQAMVQRLLGLDAVPPPDAADALALALCHARRLPEMALRARLSEASARVAAAAR